MDRQDQEERGRRAEVDRATGEVHGSGSGAGGGGNPAEDHDQDSMGGGGGDPQPIEDAERKDRHQGTET